VESHQRLAQEIWHLVADLPLELVEDLAHTLDRFSAVGWQQLRMQVPQAFAQPGVRERVGEFVDFWQAHAPGASAKSVSLALLAAAQAEEYHRQRQQVELVWTGPDSRLIPLRRTDQALLQLINEARETLHIVSFAVYKVKAIAQALVRAAQRGVSIAIYLETPEASEGRIAFDTIGPWVRRSYNMPTSTSGPWRDGPTQPRADTARCTPRSPWRMVKRCWSPAPI